MALQSVCTVLAANSMIMADVKAEYLACPIRQVVSRFGDKWSMLVLYMLHTSKTGVLRFNEIRRLMTDCSQKMLSATLKVPSVYRGLRLIYTYDDGFHDDFNVSEELKIEYYD